MTILYVYIYIYIVYIYIYYITIDITIDIQYQFYIPRYLNSDYINDITIDKKSIIPVLYHRYWYHLIDIIISYRYLLKSQYPWKILISQKHTSVRYSQWHGTHTHGAAVALLLLLGQDHDRSVRGGNCRRRFRRGQQVRPRKSRGGERGI